MSTGRYDRAAAEARDQVLSVAVRLARKTSEHAAAVVRPGGDLRRTTEMLGQYLRDLTLVLSTHQLAVSVDLSGRPDPLGETLARLMADLQYVVVRFRNLDRMPPALVAESRRAFAEVDRSARAVRAVPRLDGTTPNE